MLSKEVVAKPGLKGGGTRRSSQDRQALSLQKTCLGVVSKGQYLKR